MKELSDKIIFFIQRMKNIRECYNKLYSVDPRLEEFVIELDCFYEYDKIALAYIRDCIPTDNDLIAYKYIDRVYELLDNTNAEMLDSEIQELLEELLKEIKGENNANRNSRY